MGQCPVFLATAPRCFRRSQFHGAHPERLVDLNAEEWSDLVSRAEFARLMIPLSQTCAEFIPASVLARVQQNISDTALRFQKIQGDYIAITEAFKAANVQHLVVKGFALCPDFLAHPRFRMQSDIDIYCTPESIHRAVPALHAIGYETRMDADHLLGHHLPPLGKKTDWKWRGYLFDPELPIGIELHYRFSDETLERFDPQGLEKFWERRVEHEIDGMRFSTLSTVDPLWLFRASRRSASARRQRTDLQRL